MSDRDPVLFGRRTFIRAAAGVGAGFVLYSKMPGGATQALAAIPGGTLSPEEIPKFVSRLLVPPVMPRAGTVRQQGGANADYYEISMRQFAQQILPRASRRPRCGGTAP
ncbi:hypothetical protein [Nocardioides piscis]|uniref:hypothetical protein n=1 Tax=Nocardioides piscis TaxID=2714938 RepID=UPI00197DAC5E|nr:hypothetical protein [Nocardioides piscis]